MTARSFPRPQFHWLALALTACLAFTASAAASASAAQTRSLETVNLCIQQSGPEKGNIRFVKPSLRCLKSEKRVVVLTTKGQQGVLGIEAESGPAGSAGTDGAPGAQGIQGPQGIPGAPGPQGPSGLSTSLAESASSSKSIDDGTDDGNNVLASSALSNSAGGLWATGTAMVSVAKSTNGSRAVSCQFREGPAENNLDTARGTAQSLSLGTKDQKELVAISARWQLTTGAARYVGVRCWLTTGSDSTSVYARTMSVMVTNG